METCARPESATAQFTSGPWVWFLSKDGIDLRTPDRGQLLILDTGNPMAKPRLRFAVRTQRDRGGLMRDANTLVTKPHGRPGIIEIDNPDARLIPAAPDHAIVLREMAAGRMRWEPYPHDPNRGELCFNGLRHSTRLDEFGCPEITDVLRADAKGGVA
jgi:hypothetical protein